MKREIWQTVYAPRGDALERRVQAVLSTLSEERPRVGRKRMWAAVLTAAMIAASALALAAGLALSGRMDAKTAARQALQAQYGFTPEMEAFFTCEVSPDGRTVVFSPDSEGMLAGRLGTYTVTLADGGAEAVWSHDGEAIGEALTSPVWNTALLGEALARKAAGEEWVEILLPQERLTVNITQEQAIAIAREAAGAALGEDVLVQFPRADAHLYYEDAGEAERDGHSVRRWDVWLLPEEGMEEWITVRLYADDGQVFDCLHHTQEEEIPTQDDALMREADARSAQAQALAALTHEQAMRLAREAIGTVYGLTPQQLDRLEWQEDYDPSPYSMKGDTPMLTEWFWLWQSEGEDFTEGDGMYRVEVNAETGVIENVTYDSGLSGNG